MALLEIRDLCVNYGPIQAVRNINMDVEEGSIVALLGANGAGKTTTLRTISGVIKPASGSVKFDGNEIGGRRASRVARLGVNMSPEGRLIFNELSVEENLRAGAYCIRIRAETERNMKRVLTLFPRLEERLKQHAGTLSGGEQQMLAISRALMASPKLLLLDEPSLGLAPLIIRDIFRALQEIRAEGTTILIVEQNALATLKIADRAYVLELGRISMEGRADVLIHDEKLIEAYLGNKKA
ncbi:MAG: ABC transporter ATP-binding protein [Oscillospiraceae bacterium]